MDRKQKIIEAFCAQMKWNPAQHGTKTKFVKDFIKEADEQRERMIAGFPTGKEQVRQIAMQKLSEELRMDNADVIL